jgi:pimeloyl-ACP methyl ester carboxylesterase
MAAGFSSSAILKLGFGAWICAAVTGCAVVDYEQRRWIFQPVDDIWEPAVEAAAGMQDVWIEFVSAHPEHPGQHVRLHGLWLVQPEPSAPALLFLHGVRWDVRASAPRMRQLYALGFSVLAIDHRGFGQSTAVMPSETLVAEDARAAWD